MGQVDGWVVNNNKGWMEMPSLKKKHKWWVLAVGEEFAELGFDGRDLCRAKLLKQIQDAGIILDENVWVYDKDECAQLVIAACDSRDEAEAKVLELKSTELTIKVCKEFE